MGSPARNMTGFFDGSVTVLCEGMGPMKIHIHLCIHKEIGYFVRWKLDYSSHPAAWQQVAGQTLIQICGGVSVNSREPILHDDDS
jgi:hypothetical protein